MDKQTEDRQFLKQMLLTAVESLTKPNKYTIEQDNEITHVITPSLLEQLDDCVQSTQIYGTKRGATLANTRNVLDLSAIILLEQISNELDDLRKSIHDVGGRTPNLADALVQWYIHFQLYIEQNPATHITPALKTLNGWITQITLKLDPPVVLDITRPCPKCKAEHVYDHYDDRHRAVVVAWRKTFRDSKAECRSCGHTWVGERELRELRWQIDEEDTTDQDTP